jgi:hypothetical protein
MIGARLLKPTDKLKKWYVAFDRQVLNTGIARQYTSSLITEAARSGVTLPQPEEFIETEMHQLEEVFKKAKANSVHLLHRLASGKQI